MNKKVEDYLVVKFSDGTYFRKNGVLFNEKTTINIIEATTYTFDWQIHKDLYLQQYLHEKKLSYEVIKVKVVTMIEIGI
ncbi:hypothetical protein [Paenibacillus sp. QZ-Y1]|uniref:hypothetical protein n=1 Tax=Paenibacillus sp. QZ-Y1 TaxID=3414511 RepID=UPI003F7AD6BF